VYFSLKLRHKKNVVQGKYDSSDLTTIDHSVIIRVKISWKEKFHFNTMILIFFY